MRYILIILMLVTGYLNAETIYIDIQGEEYEVFISDNPEDLRSDFIEAVTLYMEESIDHERSIELHNEYKDSSDTVIASLEKDIDLLEDQIATKEDIIKKKDIEIKEGNPLFQLTPFGTVIFKDGLEGFGLGLSLNVRDLMTQIAIQYPIQISLSLGWRF